MLFKTICTTYFSLKVPFVGYIHRTLAPDTTSASTRTRRPRSAITAALSFTVSSTRASNAKVPAAATEASRKPLLTLYANYISFACFVFKNFSFFGGGVFIS